MSESEAFTAIFGDAIKTMMREVLEERETPEEESGPAEFYTRKQVMQMLKICKATYHNWCNKGVFKTMKIENKVYVLKAPFDKAMAEDKFVKYRVKAEKR